MSKLSRLPSALPVIRQSTVLRRKVRLGTNVRIGREGQTGECQTGVGKVRIGRESQTGGGMSDWGGKVRLGRNVRLGRKSQTGEEKSDWNKVRLGRQSRTGSIRHSKILGGKSDCLSND
jgi:UDP-3-O-[3-hydroxymyristoyl] glucosamine N-acyltransferase